MSSFLAKLELDGETYNVLKCKYEFSKPIDVTTKPSGDVVGGKIKITIESRGTVDLLEWIIAPDKEKNGNIEFFRHDEMSRLKNIQFEKGYCIHFKEKFNSVNNKPMSMTLVIVAKKIKFKHLEFNNDWTA